MLFWSLVLISTIVVMVAVLWPLFRIDREAAAEEDHLRTSIYRENLQELDGEYERGMLDNNQLVNVKHELELSLLKETAESERNKDKIKQSSLTGNNNIAAAILGILLIAGALSLYTLIGNPQLNELKEFSHALSVAEEGELPPLEGVADSLRLHLERNPEDLNGWLLLSNIYTSTAEYDNAVFAYEQLYNLAGDNPEILVQYVNALVRANDGSFQGKVADVLQQLLRIDPGNYTGLFYSGLAADEAGNYRQANQYYYKILPVLRDNPELLQTVNFLISRNEQLISMSEPEMQESFDNTVQASSSVALHISVTDALQEKFAPDDTLYVYAQALEGSPMPLAVVRLRAGDLPVDVVLDDSMAMTPAMKLSGFDKVKLLARISKSGNAQPESGDLSGVVSEISVAATDTVNLVIDTVVP